MISVIVNREGNLIRAIYANGHAGYDEPGRDIICSGVSTLLFTAASALEDICGYDSESFFRISGEGTEDVNLRITVPDMGDDETKNRAQGFNPIILLFRKTSGSPVIANSRDK